MVEVALAHGDNVVATLRTPSALADLARTFPATQLAVVPLDVTQADGVPRAFAAAQRAFGRIDVVFNNAGISAVGEAEGVPDETARRVFDVNFWGAVAVSREAVRFFREQARGGRLLTVSSVAAHETVPCAAYYCASKSGTRPFLCLCPFRFFSSEVNPSSGGLHTNAGIRGPPRLGHQGAQRAPSPLTVLPGPIRASKTQITLIVAGYVRSPMRERTPTLPPHPAYTDPAGVPARTRDFLDAITVPGKLHMSNLGKMVDRIYEASLLARPPLRLFLGKDTLDGVRSQRKLVGADLEAYASWSEELLE
jgi:hypothetical protein